MEKRTVLFVDDEEKILRSLKRVFVGEPYKTLFVNSGKLALDILKKKQVHVIITDIRMPGMDGHELLKTVKNKYPNVIRLVLSGYSDKDTLLHAINQGEIFRYITKPWKLNEELKTIVRQAIEFFDLHSERESLLNFIEKMAEEPDLEKVDFRYAVKMLISARDKR
ncbi:MAG: response regulator [Planctomycetes bacterium]|nr:response regulator [Planctomycetota bacterium]